MTETKGGGTDEKQPMQKEDAKETTAVEDSKSSNGLKTIYLIRHAESEENRRIASLKNVWKSMGRFSLPTSSDCKTSFELCNMADNLDCDVSDIGMKQIQHMGDILTKDKFVENNQITLVVHSPLMRARKTSEGLLGCSCTTATQKTMVPPVQQVVQSDFLLEKTPSEWIPTQANQRSFIKRMEDFQAWLKDQSDQKIAVVGHSQYFRAMLGLDYKFDNCEVYQVQFDPSQHDKSTTTPGKNDDTSSQSLPAPWSNLKKLYDCDIKR